MAIKTSTAAVNSTIKAIQQITNGSLSSGLTLLAGSRGCGKTIFSGQYAFEVLQAGGKVVWITTEELPSTLREEMKGFGWDATRHESERRFVIYDAVSPSRLGLSENIGHGMLGLDPTGMLIVISEHLRSLDAGAREQERFLFVLDSVSRLLLSCDSRAVVDFISCLNSRMENAGVRGLALVSDEVHEEKLLNSLIFSSSGTIRFRVSEQNESRTRQLRVETMRGKRHDDSWKNYLITNTGLDIWI
ncbi:MAG: AAA family ATPase [Nitrososphaerota archaeon]|nr:AAA family ATPase [Nitrososphaerota archaeon]